MRRGGGKWRHPYEVRLNAVRQYLTGDDSAAEIATSLGVAESTMRRYVRDLRGILEDDTPTATSPNGPTHT
jgi:transposase-like protein